MQIIEIEIQYRDDDNFKSQHEAYYTNNDNISQKDIDRALKAIAKRGSYWLPEYGIPQYAPVDNPYIPQPDSDHCNTEIIGWKSIEHLNSPDITDGDISTVVELAHSEQGRDAIHLKTLIELISQYETDLNKFYKLRDKLTAKVY